MPPSSPLKSATLSCRLYKSLQSLKNQLPAHIYENFVSQDCGASTGYYYSSLLPVLQNSPARCDIQCTPVKSVIAL